MSTPGARDAWGAVPSGERWSAGRWSLDVRGDELADVRCDGQIVLRAIRAVARDEDWSTAWPTVAAHRAEGDTLVLELEVDAPGLTLSERLHVEADGDRLAVTLEAVARAETRTNRTGLVVLHPPRLAGQVMGVGHCDGSEEALTFPVALSPHQPARDITALSWSDHGIPLRVELEGEVFEMEDQRNWSDASYKTYSRPLAEPFPYTLAAGERAHQRVVLTAGDGPAGGADAPRGDGRAEEPAPQPDVLTLTAAGTVPLIAVGASSAPDPAPATPDPVAAHAHVELDLRDPAWPAALGRARRGAEDLAVLLVSATPPDPAVLAEVAGALRDVPLRWAAIVDATSHVTEPGSARALRAALGAVRTEAVPVVGGSRSHYTELNREWDRVPHGELDALVFPTTPLFHTLETEQLVESVAMQRLLATEAAARAPGTPVHIGPVTLRPRFNNVATRPVRPPRRTDLAEGYGAHRTGAADPRQDSPELAAWTIASAAALAVPGIASLTWFEDWGPRGLRRADGTDRPVRAALAALAALPGRALLSGASPDGLLWALGAQDAADGASVLLANLSDRHRTVDLQLPGVPIRRAEVAPWSWHRPDLAAESSPGHRA
ncbi:hypothetical protein [Brachybacterium sp. YJGR34]|uniref:hypothetical protein n=1 Tax=Brachybacterium sp. YJGR34 TaxID=2059911 RepID=UPI000E0BF73A|nr:hypothetical protein [Brachybacterium sp. YJGR34]